MLDDSRSASFATLASSPLSDDGRGEFYRLWTGRRGAWRIAFAIALAIAVTAPTVTAQTPTEIKRHVTVRQTFDDGYGPFTFHFTRPDGTPGSVEYFCVGTASDSTSAFFRIFSDSTSAQVTGEATLFMPPLNISSYTPRPSLGTDPVTREPINPCQFDATIPEVNRTVPLGRNVEGSAWLSTTNVGGVSAHITVACTGLAPSVPCTIATATSLRVNTSRERVPTASQPHFLLAFGNYIDPATPRCRVEQPLKKIREFKDNGKDYPPEDYDIALEQERISRYRDQPREALEQRTLGYTIAPKVALALHNKMTAFEDSFASRAQPAPYRKSGYRPPPYQRHLYELNTQSEKLREALKDPSQFALCQERIDEVEGEKDQHSLTRRTNEPFPQTVQVSEFLPAHAHKTDAGEPQALALDMSGYRAGLTPAQLAAFASSLGLLRPFPGADPPHFIEISNVLPPPGYKWLIASPVDVLLRDPLGRRVGFDSATGQVVNELGENGYFSGRGTEPAVIEIGEVVPGTYTLNGIGNGNGPYRIEVTKVALAGPETIQVFTGTALDGTPITPVVIDVPIPTADTVSPIVTPPNPLVIQPSELGGARGSAVASLAAFLAGSTATDNADPSPSRIGPVVDGAPATNDTLFPLGTTTVTFAYEDATGNVGSANATVTVTTLNSDTTAPIITTPPNITVTATSATGQAVTYVVTVSDEQDPSPSVSCLPQSGAVFPITTTTVNCSARDSAGNTATAAFLVTVIPVIAPPRFTFTGFFTPVDNLPALNSVKAGAAVPLKFSLGGDYGLNVIASGYPRARVVACQAAEVADAIEETLTAGKSRLLYDQSSGQYVYVWQTDKAWANSCRELQITFTDGQTRSARFIMRK